MEESLEMQVIRKLQERIEGLKFLLESSCQMLELTNSSLDDFLLSGVFEIPEELVAKRRNTSKKCTDAIAKMRTVVNSDV